jgi:hypothetical protein
VLFDAHFDANVRAMNDVVDFEPSMGASGRPGDWVIAEKAAQQHGVVAYEQLMALGFGRRAVQHRVTAGRLHPLYIGVFSVGHSVLSAHGRRMAAVLACGAGALLSHLSAAAHEGLVHTDRSAIDITVPGRSRKGRPGIDLHLVRRLHPDDRTVVQGIPTTSIARTLLDIAATRPRLLERAFEAAERLQLLDLRAIHELLDRSHGCRGRPALAALTDRRELPPATRSELERDFLRLCDDAGLPLPLVNVIVEGFEVDAAWPNRRLVVELDSREFHLTRAAFERDRVRDAKLQLAGYRVLRVTHRRLHTESSAIVDTVRRLLSR